MMMIQHSSSVKKTKMFSVQQQSSIGQLQLFPSPMHQNRRVARKENCRKFSNPKSNVAEHKLQNPEK